MCYHTPYAYPSTTCAANNVLINGETESFNLRLGYSSGA